MWTFQLWGTTKILKLLGLGCIFSKPTYIVVQTLGISPLNPTSAPTPITLVKLKFTIKVINKIKVLHPSPFTRICI